MPSIQDDSPPRLSLPRQIYLAGLLALAILFWTLADHLVDTKRALPHLDAIYGFWFPAYSLYVLAFSTLSVFLFILRSRWRFLYAALEVAVGLGVLVITAATYTGKVVYGNVGAVGYLPGPSTLSSTLQFVAGVYVMIRGFDNMERSIERYPRLSAWWDVIFIRDVASAKVIEGSPTVPKAHP